MASLETSKTDEPEKAQLTDNKTDGAICEMASLNSEHKTQEGGLKKIQEAKLENMQEETIDKRPPIQSPPIEKTDESNSNCIEANNNPVSQIDPPLSSRCRKGQRKAVESDKNETGKVASSKGDKNESQEGPSLKMRIKCRKAPNTRQSSGRIATNHQSKDDPGSPRGREYPPLCSPTSPGGNLNSKSESMTRSCAKRENSKRKLSSSSPSTPNSKKGLAAGKPSSFSCQHHSRRRTYSSAVLSSISSSAPTSPSAQGVATIKSRRSSPTIIIEPTSNMDAGKINSSSNQKISLDESLDLPLSAMSNLHSGTGIGETKKTKSAPVCASKISKSTNNHKMDINDNHRKNKRSSTSSNTDHAPMNKKSKIDEKRRNQKLDNCTMESSISATVTTLVPDSGGTKEKPEKQEAGTWVRTVGTVTETECLGPCEPGTSVTLEGIVWNETKGGILVVNVTWRGKTYVGTLLDCTKYDWAPPQFCDSPRNHDNEVYTNIFAKEGNSNAQKSSQKSGNGSGNGRGRKGQNGNIKRQQQSIISHSSSSNSINISDANLEQDQASNDSKLKKSRSVSDAILELDAPVLFQCPFGSCEKKFPATIGLRYHQTHSHRIITCKTMEKHLRDSKLIQEERKNSNSRHTEKSAILTSNSKLVDQNSKMSSSKSIDQKPNLDELLKQDTGKNSEKSKHQTTGSPVYSDISEDDPSLASTAQPIVSEENISIPALIQHSNIHPAIIEKPMAIVEPQCATAALTSARTGEPRAGVSTICPQKSTQSNEKSLTDTVHAKTRISEPPCPPLLPTLNLDRHKKSCSNTPKIEPGVPRQNEGPSEFAVPAQPRPASSSMGPSPSPIPVPIIPGSLRGASPMNANSMNMMHQLNPTFMFNPFNPANPVMFPGHGAFPNSTLGIESSTAAAVAFMAAAGQQSVAGMYHNGQANMSAALAAAFPMGIPGAAGGPHGLFGGPSLAAAFNCGGSPSGPAPATSFTSGNGSSRIQQAHKIHELSGHLKRSAASDSVIVEALRRGQPTSTGPSSNSTIDQKPRIPSLLSDSDLRQKQCSSTIKPPTSSVIASSSNAVPTSVITSQSASDSYGHKKTPELSKDSLSKVAPRNVSPPVQRHLHTHHHTHTTYPPMLGQAMDPYAAMVASQQAAAAAGVVNGYAPFGPSSKSS